MHKHKLCAAAAASLLAFSSLSYAAEDAQYRNLENRINALESMKPGSGMINPSARPVVKDAVDFNVFGQLLFMKPEQGGMEFATHFANPGAGIKPINSIGRPSTLTAETTLPTTNASSGPQFGRVISTQTEWDWGLRVGAGYNMAHDGWDLSATWLRFHTKHSGTNRSHQRALGAYVPLVVPPMSGQNNNDLGGVTTTGGLVSQPGYLFNVDWVTQRWRLNIDLADFELGREFFVSKWMTLRPFVGPRAAWINQDYRPAYFGGQYVSMFDGTASQATPTLVTEPHSVMRATMTNRFWGVGPRLGLNTQWGLGWWGLSIYGNADLSILWGRFRVRNQMYVTQENSTVTKIVDIHHHHQTRRPISDIAAGIRYDHVFGEMSDFALAVLLGYEHQIYWDQNQAMKFDYANSFSLGAKNDELSLAGLHFGLIFDF